MPGLLEQTRASGRLADAGPGGGVTEVSAGKRSPVAEGAGGCLPAERDFARRVFYVGVCQALGQRPEKSSVFGGFWLWAGLMEFTAVVRLSTKGTTGGGAGSPSPVRGSPARLPSDWLGAPRCPVGGRLRNVGKRESEEVDCRLGQEPGLCTFLILLVARRR